METLQIEIRNPKVMKLLSDLVDLELINIKETKSLNEIARAFPIAEDLTFDEITKEVELVREMRYN
jgi:hypothetical protein